MGHYFAAAFEVSSLKAGAGSGCSLDERLNTTDTTIRQKD